MATNTFDIKDLIRENIAKLKPYSSARDEFIDFNAEMIFLDANENPFENGLNRYPDPYQLKLKEKFSKMNSMPIENILLGNGSDEVLDLIFRAFCEPIKDNIITMPPTYGMYMVLSEINNIENKEVVLTNKFQIDVVNVLSSIDKNTKLIFICSPNNPTGNLMDRMIIEQLLENFNGLVILDEAYINFSETKSWVNEIKKYPNLIVTQTLSKAFGLAGIRLGVCYANTEIIQVLNKIKPPYNVNQLTQQKAFEVLSNLDLVKSQVKEIKKNKVKLTEALKSINFIEKIYPSEANFILVKVDDADIRYQQLLKKGMVVRNRNNQTLCKNTLRFTIGTKEEVNKLIKELKSI